MSHFFLLLAPIMPFESLELLALKIFVPKPLYRERKKTVWTEEVERYVKPASQLYHLALVPLAAFAPNL